MIMRTLMTYKKDENNNYIDNDSDNNENYNNYK